MISHLLHELTGNWRPKLESRGLSLRPPLTAIQLGSGAGTERKVNFLVFERGGKEPVLVLKTARHPTGQASLEREHLMLRALWGDTRFTNGVPRPLGFFTLDGAQVLIESYLPGKSLAVLLRRRLRTQLPAVRQDLNQALSWLGQFQSATCSEREPFPANMVVEISLVRLNGAGLPTPFAKNLYAMAKDWEWFEVPWVGRHGDYWPGNLLVGENRNLGVIDWENYTPHELPFYDLFSFATTYALALPWRRGRRLNWERRFARAFLDETWLSNELLSRVNRHLDDLSLPRKCIPFFYALFLLEKAQPDLEDDQKSRRHRQRWLDILRLYAENETESVLVKSC